MILILNQGKTSKESKEFKSFMAHARLLLKTRITFFCEGKKTFSEEREDKKSTFFQSYFAQTRFLFRTRVISTFQEHKDEHSPINLLYPEIKRYIFSFVQPGLEYDKEQGYFLPNSPTN